MVRKIYKYKLRPTPQQVDRLTAWLHTTRRIWNLSKEISEYWYEKYGKAIHKYELTSQVTDVKKDYDWMRDVPSQTLREPALRYHKSLVQFFRKKRGYPKWKGRHHWRSLVFFQQNETGLRIEQGRIKLHKGIRLRYFNSRSLPEGAKIKQIIVTKELDGWYASILFEDTNHIRLPASDSQVVGVDMGVAQLATLSTGEVIPNIRVYNQWKAKLKAAHQSLSRKKRGGKNWKKAKSKVAKIHRKIARIRKDYQQKTTTKLVRQYNGFIVEDLRIRNMVRSAKGTVENPGTNVKAKSGLNRSINDAAFASFLSMLEYKCNWNGRVFQRVDPKHTSNTCHSCGYQNKDNRVSQTEFVCRSCGLVDHADVNAAKNILLRGRAAPIPNHACAKA